MATKIIGFDIQCLVEVNQYFEIPEDYLTENKLIKELYDEIWESFGNDSQLNVLTEELHPIFFHLEEMDFIKIKSFTIEE
ncbi:MAG: hypothetical protein RLZZ529_299 [Bacteroidota bacterium]|jgi:hypothetical protein|uniref:hypothetical protein n=1 Tax=Flavobacterium sp. TaxID=239 RepID=UPI0008C03C1E|nr:hypothetical protein [Flavobacterium sp.]OGS64458.1 MAG: hypothetical protein A2X21_09215 [Flavobacteria bacterium GWA2_35_26]HCF04454.1 hypothetical protein [Flavobacterium sp.]